eukprot:3754573-Amphidinium_carterae.1
MPIPQDGMSLQYGEDHIAGKPLHGTWLPASATRHADVKPQPAGNPVGMSTIDESLAEASVSSSAAALPQESSTCSSWQDEWTAPGE